MVLKHAYPTRRGLLPGDPDNWTDNVITLALLLREKNISIDKFSIRVPGPCRLPHDLLKMVRSNNHSPESDLSTPQNETSALHHPSHEPIPHRDASVFTLADGRKLGYAQCGLLTGKPVFYCHGLPGCRIEAGHLHAAAMELGIRVIAADRPGIGLSSPQPGRKILDHASDLEELGKHLKLDSYGVMVRATLMRNDK